MRKVLAILICFAALFATTQRCAAQGYVKLNGLYALVGVVNPAVEFRLTKHSTYQAEIVYSPWLSINNHPMHFGIFMNEYRYYFKESNHGFYAAANVGMMAFNMSKPEFAKRWLLDVYFGYSFMESRYNGYSLDGEINMYPHRPDWKEPEHPDPYNGSGEWLPNKFGLSIGVLIFDPHKQK